MDFHQEDFKYKDLFEETSFLSDLVRQSVDREYIDEILSDLSQFSKKASDEVLQLMWAAESQPPSLTQYDHWGRRIDQINLSEAWERLGEIAATEGMVAIGYERKTKQFARLHQFLKLLLFHPSSAFYTCPLAMTDGAARVLEQTQGAFFKECFSHLTSRSTAEFWTAGQWMTEKTGGSDVSGSETVACEKGGRYYLYGTKWFTSAISANLSMTLAQTQVEGKNRLSLFLVKIRNASGQLNDLKVLRLKEKLGTKAMPTAEIQLEGTEGFLIGNLGQGVKNITTVLNISRLYNSVCAAGTLYRLQSLATDYAKKRQAFGQLLIDHPLHQITLLKTKADTRASVHLVTEMALLLGKSETNSATTEDASFLRLFTPIVKLWTAKVAVRTVSELIEAFGGVGYIEDSQLPRFLRDAQVFPIWEGTTNILSLDTLRVLTKDGQFAEASSVLEKRLHQTFNHPVLIKKLKQNFENCKTWFEKNQANSDELQFGARTFALSLGDCLAGLLMLEFAQATGKQTDFILADKFITSIPVPQFENHSGKKNEFKQTLIS